MTILLLAGPNIPSHRARMARAVKMNMTPTVKSIILNISMDIIRARADKIVTGFDPKLSDRWPDRGPVIRISKDGINIIIPAKSAL